MTFEQRRALALAKARKAAAEAGMPQGAEQPTPERSGLLGWAQDAYDWVSGEGRREFPDLGVYEGRNLPTGSQIRMGAGLMLAGDADSERDIVANNAPGVTITQDSFGNYIADDGEERGYINPAGLTWRDVLRTVGQGVALAPFAKVVTIGGNAASRTALAGALGGGASVAADVGAGALGSEQGISATRAGMGAAGGAAFQLGGEALMRLGRRLMSNPAYFRDGRLTAAGRKALQSSGIDPDDFSQRFGAEMARQARQGVADVPEGQTRALADSFDVPITRGQATDDAAQIAFEQGAARGGRGRGAESVLRPFMEAQNEAVGRAAGNVGDDLARGAPTVSTINEGMERTAQGVQSRAASLQSRINAAYDAARDIPASVEARSVVTLPRRVMRAITADGSVDPADMTGASKKAFDALSKLARQVSSAGGKNGKVVAVDLQRLDLLRRRFGTWFGQVENPADRRILTMMKREFDNAVDDMVDSALFSGDDAALDALKKARGLRAEYGRLFQARGKDDAAGKIVERLIEADPTPEQVQNWLFGSSTLYGKPGAAKVAERLKEILGEGSEEWAATRQASWLQMLQRATRKGNLSYKMLADDIKETLTGRGESVSKVMFSREERLRMLEFERLLRKLVPPEGTVNYSGTAYEASRQARDYLQVIASMLGFSGGGPGGAAAAGFAAGVIPKVRNVAQARAAVRTMRTPYTSVIPSTSGAVAGSEVNRLLRN